MNSKALVVVVVIAAIAAIAYPKLRKARIASAAQDRNFLPTLMVEVNNRLPTNPEPDIVFFRADMKEGLVTYNFRVEKTDANNLLPEQKADIRRRITKIICDDADAARVRKNDGTVRGNIGDRTGTPIGTVAVLPNGC
jgi:hypothetical protein